MNNNVAFTRKVGNTVFSWEKYGKQVIMSTDTATRVLGEACTSDKGNKIIDTFIEQTIGNQTND